MINKNLLSKFLQKSYLIRFTEEEISKKYKEKKMRCPIHLSIGQEIPSAALNLLLTKRDHAISYHRAHAHYLAKGGSLKKMIAEIYGKKTGCSGGVGGSMHLVDKNKNFIGSTAIVSSSIPVGAGFAYSIKNKKDRVCIYIGDASCEEGVFFETLNFVVLKKLPVIFFCENNKYSVYSNLSVRQPKNRKLYKLAKAFGIKSYNFSSINPIDLYKNLKKVLNNNYEPVFIEVSTYRYLEHCGPNQDDDLNYRPAAEIKYWLKNDPLKTLENYVINKKYIDLKKVEKIKTQVKKSIKDAFKFAEKSSLPKMIDYLKLNKNL